MVFEDEVRRAVFLPVNGILPGTTPNPIMSWIRRTLYLTWNPAPASLSGPTRRTYGDTSALMHSCFMFRK